MDDDRVRHVFPDWLLIAGTVLLVIYLLLQRIYG